MSTENQEIRKPVYKPQIETDKRNDGGGAPGPKYTIPVPPKPKK